MNNVDAIRQNINYEAFYSGYFPKYKKLNGSEWKVCCPFHDDKNPSMTVNVANGKYNCFGCDAQGDFIKFYQKKHGVDFKKAVDELMRQTNSRPMPEQKPEIVETYDYKDIRGNLVSQTVRYEPKKFSQRTKKNGKWVWSLKGVDTVLYNLPEVVNSDKVLVMEGEKDCETAREFGFVATTCPMGAGKWRESYNHSLEGKEVVLIPDNDPVGIKHMLSVGNQLENRASVKWFEFPGQNPKGYDFSDFAGSFENEFDAMDQLDKLIRSARAFDPSKIIIPEPDSHESDAIKEWIQASPGEFSVRDLDYEMGFTSSEDKQKRTRILEKFVAEKVLSREGKKRGVYRPYKAELEPIDYINADDKFLDLWLPLGIQQMVGVMGGNVLIFAGEPNAGKTALMLNIIKSNMRKFNVHYFNSEMGAGEMKGRLSKFEDLPLSAWKFNAYSRDADFADVVFTGENSLNIIDFLEIHDDFYLVGEKIKKIHAALNGGIAIICIQKNKGSEMALGGNRTMEKARLVVNVEPGRLKITKAKNFKNSDLNPNGLMCDFKLVNGCKLVMSGTDWYKKE